MTNFTEKTKYRLQSISTGRMFDDAGWTLDDDQSDKPTLIRAIYDKKQIDIKSDDNGFYKFADWLPVAKYLKGSSAPVTYKSEGFAKHLGLKNLYITFSGYWPEIGANMPTCSFKETEAYSVCGRLSKTDKILVVASAGNTARAFARVCSDNDIPLLLCVPEEMIDVLWFDEPIKKCVKLIISAKGSDYYDAIHLSNLACKLDKFVMEGGAKNVARRDGMGTTVLSAASFIGKIPEYYFQAVGSGTGAIAAWEANLRLIGDGRFGNNKMKLMVSQNEPFIPLFHAWNKRSRELGIHNHTEAREQVARIDAKVLSNRKPPYGLAGGLFDALADTNGEVLTVSNTKGREAAKLFLELEGNDLHPAAAIAAASLIDAVNNKKVEKDAVIMLNVTGGGEEKFKHEKQLHYLKPELVFDIDPDIEDVKSRLGKLFSL